MVRNKDLIKTLHRCGGWQQIRKNRLKLIFLKEIRILGENSDHETQSIVVISQTKSYINDSLTSIL